MIRHSLFLICTLVLFSFPALAEITSGPCPHNCKTVGIKKESNCRDWKEGNICFVEDLRKKGKKKQKPQKGVTSHACPYSCKETFGLGKKKCSDWKENNMCFVKVL